LTATPQAGKSIMGDQLESWRFGATLAENGVETCERFAPDPDGFDDIRYPNAICSPIGQRPLDATDTGDVLTPSFKELEDLLKAAMARGDPTLDAYCQNYLLEERVSRGPQADYEGAVNGHASDFNAWDRWHRDQYLPRAIHQDVPETFTALSSSAAHSGDLQKDQWLIRVENLKYALGETGLTIDRLQEILDVATGVVPGGKLGLIDAQDSLAGVCDSLNCNPHSVRPRFAGFLQDLEGALEESDWPDRIRDRFGPVLTNDRYRDVSNLPRKVSC